MMNELFEKLEMLEEILSSEAPMTVARRHRTIVMYKIKTLEKEMIETMRKADTYETAS